MDEDLRSGTEKVEEPKIRKTAAVVKQEPRTYPERGLPHEIDGLFLLEEFQEVVGACNYDEEAAQRISNRIKIRDLLHKKNIKKGQNRIYPEQEEDNLPRSLAQDYFA
jgi:hypothetical protein